MGIRWQDRVTNQEVLDTAGLTSIQLMLLRAPLRWTGHVVRTTDRRIPRQLLYGELKHGSRKQGRPELRHKDNLKMYLKWSSIKPSQLEASAADRAAWRCLASSAAAAFEEDRRQRFAAAREMRARSTSIPIQTTEYQCDTCGYLWASSFGLRSHMRSHR